MSTSTVIKQDNLMNFTPKVVREALGIGVQAGLRMLVVGGIGEGKTSYMYALAESIQFDLRVLCVGTREPTDFAGVMYVDPKSGELKTSRPSWSVRNGHPLFIFWDELTTGAPATQNAALTTIQSGMVGDYYLDNDTIQVAACNPVSLMAAGTSLTPPLANRFTWLKWQFDIEAWRRGMVLGWSKPTFPMLPAGWYDDFGQTAGELCVEYSLRFEQDINPGCPVNETGYYNEEQAAGPWPSPRTWEFAKKALAACLSLGYDHKSPVLAALLCGSLGKGVGEQFITFMSERSLPDPEACLADPNGFALPTRGDQIFSLLQSVAGAVIKNMSVDRYYAAWQVLQRFVNRQDLAMTTAITLCRKDVIPPAAFIPPVAAKEFMPFLMEAGILKQAMGVR